MRKLYSLLFLLSLLSLHIKGQGITEKGYTTKNWGSPKTQFSFLKDCSSSYINPDISNCARPTDSMFLGKFPYKYCNYRFFQDKFFEVNYDFDSDKLPFIVAELSKQLGNPSIQSKETNPKITNDSYILYSWIKGDSKVYLLKKENIIPGWLNICSKSIKGSIPAQGEISIESILFEQ